MKFVENKVGRLIPEYIEGIGTLKPFTGIFDQEVEGRNRSQLKSRALRGEKKLLETIKDAS